MPPSAVSLPPGPGSLQLVIPGLIWPRQAWLDLTRGLDLPGLAALLHLQAPVLLDAGDTDTLLATRFGLPSPLPAAALRRQTLGLGNASQADGRWLCLDPVHLGFADRYLIPGDPAELALSADEAAALARDLAPLLAELGTLAVDAPQAWHLHLAPGTSVPAALPLPEAVGVRADAALGTLDSAWRRVLNDIQMTLHAHPCNRQREAEGRPAVNSLWPWGGGTLPTRPRTATNAAPDGVPVRVLTSDPVRQGLGIFLGAGGDALPDGFPAAIACENTAATTLILLETLAVPARTADAVRWQQALLDLDARWLQPAARQFAAGNIRHLVVDFPGRPQGRRLALGAGERWKGRLAFWRHPARKTLEALAA